MTAWRVDLICCGTADGHVVRETWDEADQFRESYIRAPGHDRAGIVSEDSQHDKPFCNGFVAWGRPCLLDPIPDTVGAVLGLGRKIGEADG